MTTGLAFMIWRVQYRHRRDAAGEVVEPAAEDAGKPARGMEL